ncbi:AAA family ATPase [Bacillus canaveralius]|uniref:AAA family ATPase n=1 Tax=Bacillus canaveralius TaxID=1403243 RepID=UPI000F781B07|nr:AAA family ATPase [Bacillus canaveralius]RSK53267.1 EVE domain-containing protein [Bacillus canaveralius]
MSNWIFQGNPKHFDIDNYLLSNTVVNWSIRQRQYIDEVHIGDKVFIWRSDGRVKNSGGIVAFCEVSSDPYNENEDTKVDLRVIEYRLDEKSDMLLRHQLKEIPETMNLQIFKISQLTNYRLSDKEFERIFFLWKQPSTVAVKYALPKVDKFLYLFNEEAGHWFREHQYLEETHQFYENFRQADHLKTMEWADVQELGNHINAYRMPLAKKRALGNMNAPIEQYRKSLIYLVYGEAPIEQRINLFLTNEQFKLFGFGASVVSELVGNVFPDEYCFYNQRDKVAVENIMGILPNYSRGDTFATKFMKFQNSLKENKIVEKYLDIVGKKTNLPIFYEVDQFFSYIFENYGKTEQQPVEEDGPQYWVLGAGENSFMWDEFYLKEQISIGWRVLGDLKQYASKREVAEALKELKQLDRNPNNDALANYQFAYEMNIGDYVFIKKGSSKIIAFGKVVSDYHYDGTRDHHASIRKVEWLATGEWDVENGLATKTLTDITPWPDFVEKLLDIIGKNNDDTYSGSEDVPSVVKDPPASYSKEQILSEVFISEEIIEDILETLDYKNNIILQGPPGVGKTFVAKRLAYLHMGQKDDSKIEMIQFHQSYSYEEFIRGYKPDKEGKFTLKDGIFYSFCQKAINYPEDNYYMVIDEINRGNLSKIFGELMMLIEADKRGKKFSVKLAYSEGEEKFFIPKNLYLIGTMNTADRSLALVDYALRRRFSFINVKPGFHTKAFQEFLIEKGISQGFIDKIVITIDEINQEIIRDRMLGKGYEIGHSYFCPTIELVEDEQNWYDRIIRLEIAPLLKEYWFDQEEKVHELLSRV